MKLSFLLPLAVMAGSIPAAAVDFIRQIQLVDDQTIVYDIPVTGETGEVLSKPLEGDGAVFQLYAYEDEQYSPWSLLDLNAGNIAHANVSLDSHLLDLDVLGIHLDINLGGGGDETPMPKLLDEKTVGKHLPEATITLRSEDTYQPPRTRADRPYSYSLSLRKLADPLDPRGGVSSAKVERSFKVYHPDLHVPFPNGSGQGIYSEAYQFNRNGDFTDSSVYQLLPFERPTKAIGEETFTARVPLGTTGQQATIGSATIQVWPLCEATVDNIEAGKRYIGVPADARVTLKDLYPDSVTYAQIYKGEPALGRVGTVIGSSVVSFNTYAPQNAVVPLTVPPAALGSDGTYTIEVLTVTPFDNRVPERVAQVSFEIDRTIQVRGSLANSAAN
jgi:hypothetical protein